jgi:hypothetical protein
VAVPEIDLRDNATDTANPNLALLPTFVVRPAVLRPITELDRDRGQWGVKGVFASSSYS